MIRVNALLVQTAALALAAGAASAAPIFSNGGGSPSDPGLSTGTVALSGAVAPAGDVWSECPGASGVANAIAGFSSHLTGTTGAYRFADDFTIPPGASWHVDSIAFFAYQAGAGGPSSPFTSINLRIWSGRPGDAGSAVVFGDTSTNRLTASAATNILRIFNSTALPSPAAPDALRRVWRTDAAVNTTLGPGTYWLDWQYTTSATGGDAFSPPVTIAGQRTRAGANARQFQTASGGVWVDVLDTGKPATAADVAQDFPFIIDGSLVPACPGDADGDHAVGLGDVAILINHWSFTVTPGTDGDLDADGFVGLADLAIVINNWSAICP